MTRKSDKFIYHPTDRNIYSIDYYRRQEIFDTACKTADALIKAFEDTPELAKLLEKNKKIKAWHSSYVARKEYDATAAERRKEAEAKRREIEAAKERALQAVLAKLSPEEIEACGIKTPKPKKGILSE